MERPFGAKPEGITLGMIRATIAAVKDGAPKLNVFVPSLKGYCDVCGDEYRYSQNGDVPPRCIRHR